MDDYGLFTLVVTTGEILDTAFGGWVRIFILSSESRPRRPSARRLGRILLLAGGSCILSLLIGLLIPIMQPNLSGHFVIAVSMYVLAFASLRLGLTLLQTQQRHHLYAGIEMMRGLLALGGGMLVLAVQVYRNREGAAALRSARQLFGFSILYLFALYAILLLEVVVAAAARLFW